MTTTLNEVLPLTRELDLADRAKLAEQLLSSLDEPSMGSPVDDEQRKSVLRRFPYNLIYAVAGDEGVITAVAHHKRRPFYWSRRGRK